VSGIVASSYVSFQAMEVPFWGTLPLSHHAFLHMLAAPFRFICSGVCSGVCSSVDEDGMPLILAWSIDLMEWILTCKSKVVQCVGFIFLVAVAGLFAVIETVLSAIPVASLELCVLTFVALNICSRQCKKHKVA
jgi:hypothetical protein